MNEQRKAQFDMELTDPPEGWAEEDVDDDGVWSAEAEMAQFQAAQAASSS